MAQMWTTGPALIYTAAGISGTPLFLGTAQSPPSINHDPTYEDVFNDLGGTKVPFERAYQGRRGTVRLDLNRFNQAPLALLEDFASAGSGTLGADDWGDVGTLMMAEGVSPQLWVRFPYQTVNPAMVGQVPGYHYFFATVESVQKSTGTVPQVVGLVFTCLRVFVPSSLRQVLYDINMAGLPVLD